MGRKLNLSHLTEDECEKILHVLQKDFEVRQTEKERIGFIQNTLKGEQNKTHVLSQQSKFNKNCCIRCCQVFGLIFRRRRQCYHCGYNVCRDCCNYQADTKRYTCHFCENEKEVDKQSCDWFYNSVGHKFRRFGSAKVVRSLYKTTSYCKLRHVVTQGGLNNNKLIIISKNNNDNNNNNKNKAINSLRPDTEADTGYRGRGLSQSCNIHKASKGRRPPLPDLFRPDKNHVGVDDDSIEDDDRHDLSNSPTSSSRLSSSPGRAGSRPVSRPGSLDSLNPSSSSSSRQQKNRIPDPSKRHAASDLGRSRPPEHKRSRARWDDEAHTKGKVKKDDEDIYQNVFKNARQAEENKFKAKFDVLLNDLHRTLDDQSPNGLTDSFASTSYGEVMLSFRGRVKDLVIGFSQRLQLAYESFDNCDSPQDHTQEVKQDLSRFLEDLLGESLDLTSDEAVSDLSSLSDDSGSNRHAFQDQVAQAVVSKILDSHRREVHHTLHQGQHARHLTHPILVPQSLAIDDDEADDIKEDDDEADDIKDDDGDKNDINEDDGRLLESDDTDVRESDISRDLEDLKNFVLETQSRSRQLEDSGGGSQAGDCGEEEEGQWEECGEGLNKTNQSLSSDRHFPSLPDFSQFEQLDFNSNEVDPDLIQMNLAIIPEETEAELEEEEAADTHWRENWIFKGQASSDRSDRDSSRRRLRSNSDQPQYMMVPRPDDDLTPKIGNRDVDQLSDNEELLTDDDTSFYPRTSEELARISRHKRSLSPPSFASPSLIPTFESLTSSCDSAVPEDAFRRSQAGLSSRSPKRLAVEPDHEDIGVGTEDYVGPIMEKTHKELKLLEDLLPAEGDDPKFVMPPESITIQEGEPAKFSCRVSGTQPIDVFWYREKGKVEELEDGEEVEVMSEGDGHQVTLYNLTYQQAGQYMCIALSNTGKAIKYFTVTVKDNRQERKKPEFLKEIKDVEVMEGQSVKFRCKVKGYPQPRINWYKDGKLLKSSRSCRMEKFGNRDYILAMDYATMDDDAEYMVVASNIAGHVKSTAQVIVEPYVEGQHRLLRKSSLQSISTMYSDCESESASASMLDDWMTSSRNLTSPFCRSSLSVDGKENVDCMVGKVCVARDSISQEADSMLHMADKLTALNCHLEDMERHLDSVDGRPHSPLYYDLGQRHRPAPLCHDVDRVTALAMVEDELAMGQAARNVRKLTSNALSVLRAAEEIIQCEKNASGVSSSASVGPDNACRIPSEENYNTNTSAFLASDQSLLPSQCDLNQSVSSGYGTISMASSAMDENVNDGLVPEDPVSQPGLPTEDEFALFLPALHDEGLGSYREEVSVSLSSSNSHGQSQRAKSSGAASSASSTLTNSSESSSSSGHTIQPPPATSTARNSSHSDVSHLLTHQQPASYQPLSAQTEHVADCPLAVSDLNKDSTLQDSLVVNFGPKQINTAAYVRDYEVSSHRAHNDGADRKRWSVTLNPYSPSAHVVNREQDLQETEEQIYLTAGKMFNLEDRVKELQSRIAAEGTEDIAHSLSYLEDQVARTAARVARSEKEVSSIERAVNTFQFSPRSSRGSTASSASTLRESIDSGVSSFAQDRPERPQPVHLMGHTLEEDMSETRAEYDADSGLELPSVTRLKAMFGSGGREEDSTLRRVHSITARSLTSDQLHKLRDAGNSRLGEMVKREYQTGPQHHGEVSQEQSEASISSVSLTLSPSQGRQQESGPRRQIRSATLLEPACFKQLDPSNEPVLIYPEVDRPAAYTLSTSAAGNSKSVVLISSLPAVAASGHRTAGSATKVRSVSPPSAVAGVDQAEAGAKPRIRSGCISARAAFWERRIMQEEATDEYVEEEFPEMVQDSEA